MIENKRSTESDWSDPDDAPELSAPEWQRKFAKTVVKRGRPPSGNAKQAINIRLSPDVLARFRATGPGWQRRIDEALAEWLAEHGETI
jgi:uncharacterized protein (DUF4415 family)